MTDRLYQDSVILHNRSVEIMTYYIYLILLYFVCHRSSIALQATFNIPPSLGKYLEILPKHGLVQGESCFAAQLKFLPKNDIYKECSKYINNEDPHLMEIPVNISVTGQVRIEYDNTHLYLHSYLHLFIHTFIHSLILFIYPLINPSFILSCIHLYDLFIKFNLLFLQTSSVPFFIKSVVTSSDIELSKHNIEFGKCTVYESVITSINMTNKCCLPQDYGFVHLPKVLLIHPSIYLSIYLSIYPHISGLQYNLMMDLVHYYLMKQYQLMLYSVQIELVNIILK